MVSVLLADDSPIFRHYAHRVLERAHDLQLVGQVSDGPAAVEKAQGLQPDLILLDVGLPKLNGIEAARQIREQTPRSKILFVSAIHDSEIAAQAMRSGGRGYIVKSDAGRELLTAIKAVLRGEVFVSSSLAGHLPTDSQDKKKIVTPLPPQNVRARHEVEFYPDDAAFVDGFARFIEVSLGSGNVVIVIAAESRRAGLLQRLMADGVDVGAAVEQGKFIPLDVPDVLPGFMVNDWPDTDRFMKAAVDLITRAAEAVQGDVRRVAACGECAPTLLTEGKTEAAVQLEHLWDEIARRYGVDIFCGYLSNTFQGVEGSHLFASICAEHSAVHGQQLGY